ncbi:carboxymuconolactone decarboxylase family protein [Spiractinospora alimapuensis]|uniref:carboxymuconolactone decarboxylase family protein n=1 Tax=Spiractinospora alimapuensis TaxID=2820884 RepID=UPI001F2158C8|nr:carboxymuconolactone decarboxylase family protein [Spiractinospora alimapuensis]QVQ52891.1 carboxymuconolactone decarboxylase family protein [Spiractinospora alimapuensis]
MSRIPKLRPEELDAPQREVYEEIAGGPRARGPRLFALTDAEGGLEGPFNAMLLNPALGGPLQRLGGALRFSGKLSDRSRELVILLVAAAWDSSFERTAHEAVGAHVGLTAEEMTTVAAGGTPTSLTDPEEVEALRATRLMLDKRTLDDEEYAELVASLGRERLFEVTTLVGYYGTLALQMHVFGVEG